MEENKKPDIVITEFELPPVEEPTSIAAKNKKEVGSPAWRAGQSGNPNGRPKGIKNKLSGEIKEKLQRIGIKSLGRLEEDLESMQPYQRWTILSKLMPYMTTTVSKLEVDNKYEGDVRIQVTYTEPTKTIDIGYAQNKNDSDYECQTD